MKNETIPNPSYAQTQKKKKLRIYGYNDRCGCRFRYQIYIEPKTLRLNEEAFTFSFTPVAPHAPTDACIIICMTAPADQVK